MACANILLSANLAANCNNLGGLGPTVYLANFDDIDHGATVRDNASGVVTGLTMKSGKFFYTFSSNEFENHAEAPVTMVGGQVLFNHTVTVKGGSTQNITANPSLKNWTALAKARSLVAIVQVQTTSNTDTHYQIFGLDNGLAVTGGDGYASGTNREDLNTITIQRSGMSQELPIPLQASASGADYENDLALITALLDT